MTIRKHRLRAINNIVPYTLSGATGATDHDRRLNIVKSLLGKSFAINTIPIADTIAAVVDLQEEATCISPMKMSGVVYARMYFDGTDNTGKAVKWKPAAFDTVTGTHVTGANDTWIPSEYRRIGIFLEDFEQIQPYDGPENLVLVKFDGPEKPGDGIFAMTPAGGIPARVGLEMSSAKCKIYNEVDGATGKKTLVPIMLSGGGQKEVDVYNIVNAPIGSNKIVATDATVSGTRYVNVESCLPEA